METQTLQAKTKDQLVEEVTRLYKYLSTFEGLQFEYIQSIEMLREDIEKYRRQRIHYTSEL